jgi:hypothetical protein
VRTAKPAKPGNSRLSVDGRVRRSDATYTGKGMAASQRRLPAYSHHSQYVLTPICYDFFSYEVHVTGKSLPIKFRPAFLRKPARNSGATPSGCAGAHPPLKTAIITAAKWDGTSSRPRSRTPAKNRQGKHANKFQPDMLRMSARNSGATPSGCAGAHPPELHQPGKRCRPAKA